MFAGKYSNLIIIIEINRDLARELNKTMEHEGDGDYNYLRCIWNNPERTGKGTGRLRNMRKNIDHLKYSIIKIGQNPEKSPGN